MQNCHAVPPRWRALPPVLRQLADHTPATLSILSSPQQKLLSFLEGVPLRDDWKEDAAGRQKSTIL